MSFQIWIALIAGIIVGVVLFIIIHHLFFRQKATTSNELPQFSAKEAEALIRKSGYQIISKGQKEAVITIINGKDHYGNLEADYVVQKNRRQYVVVVHTEAGDADPNEPVLRRRLLEYDRVFSPSGGVLVLDLVKGRVHHVGFRFPHEWNIDLFFRFLIALFIIAMVIGIIWMLTTLKLF